MNQLFAVFKLNRTGEIIQADNLFIEITGYSKSNIINKSIFKLISNKKDSDALKSFLQSSDSNNLYYSGEIEIKKKNNSTAYLMIQISNKNEDFDGICTNISDYKKNSQRFFELNKEYNKVLSDIREVVFELDNKFTIRFINKFWEELTGFKVQNSIGLSFTDFFDLEHQEELLNIFNLLLSGKLISSQISTKLKDKDDFFIHVEIFINAVLDSNGNISGISGTLRDVTIEKMSEIELSQILMTVELQKSLYHGILDSIPIKIYFKDNNGKYLFVNKEAVSDFGKSSIEEISGKTDFELFDPIRALKHEKEDLALKKTGIPIKKQKGIAVGTNEKHFLTTKLLSNPENPEESGIIGYSIDITNRVKLENEINRQKDFIRSVIDTAPLLIFIKDKKGNFILVNKETAAIFGKTPEEMEYVANAAVHKPADEVDHFNAIDQEVINTGKQIEIEEKFTLEDGTIIWYNTIKKPITFIDGSINVLGISADITDRKKNEEELIRAKNQAEEAARTKSQFLSIMSHEIRTPMNAVIGMTNFLLQENPKPEQMENLKLLKFSAENLLALINDILDFSKIDAGKLDLEEISFNLPDLINWIYQTFKLKAEGKGIVLKAYVSPMIPTYLIGDPYRISQILNNLLSNAVKFTESGSVMLTSELLENKNGNAKILFSVKDTGIGIAEDKISSIFDAFTQATTDTTRKFGGTGLGLAIIKRLLHLLNSEIRVNSSPGKGSDFHFTLNLKISKTNSVTEKLTPAPEQKDISGMKLLLVEDNEINIKLTRKFIRKWGIEPDIAINGLRAVEMVKEKEYDLILMDLQMPIMDGFQATREIRLFNQSVPIIALSADVMNDVKSKAEEYGMNGFISKPFNPDDLLNQISKFSKIKNL